MTRQRILVVLLLAALAGTAYWVATKTEWVDIEVPMPARGEARTNPTYAAQRFVEALGARATRDLVLAVPPPTSVIVLSAWTWDLSPAQRGALERWVEAGGRLVIDSSVTTNAEFRRWSGIGYDYRESEDDDKDDRSKKDQPCRAYGEEKAEQAGAVAREPHMLCDFDDDFFLTTRRPAEWTLRDADKGVQVARVGVGRGSVTMANGDPFRLRRLFDGDHGWLLVKAAGLQGGDDVHFLSEGDYPSLLALTWQRGAPVVVLSAVLIGFLLWRGAVRFGPLAAPEPTARRSLAEQIRGTGRFALHHGGSESLHAATVRALDEAARRRVAGYAQLQAKARTDAVARLAGVEASALATAVFNPRARRPHEFRGTIALLEATRRRLIANKARSSHGNDAIERNR
jgi:hypothetical protein